MGGCLNSPCILVLIHSLKPTAMKFVVCLFLALFAVNGVAGDGAVKGVNKAVGDVAGTANKTVDIVKDTVKDVADTGKDTAGQATGAAKEGLSGLRGLGGLGGDNLQAVSGLLALLLTVVELVLGLLFAVLALVLTASGQDATPVLGIFKTISGTLLTTIGGLGLGALGDEEELFILGGLLKSLSGLSG